MPTRGPAATAGDVLALVRSGQAQTRSEIAAHTGLSRTAVTARVTALLRSGLLVEGDDGASTGGRPAAQLRFDPTAGLVASVAIGRSRTQVAVCDLHGEPLATAELEQEVGATPDEVMPTVVASLRTLLTRVRRRRSDLIGAGVSIPGTVDAEAGVSLSSPIMRGWDGVRLAPYFSGLGGFPVHVDNDAHVMALSERSGHLETYDDALVVKASTGIGAGIVTSGRLLRGALGASGEIGHTKTPSARGRTCRCGDTGCLEAVAGGWAIVQGLREKGSPVGHLRELVDQALEGDASARRLIRESGRRAGEVIGGVVNVLNPEVLVLGGDMVRAYDVYVAGVRESLYSHATALATRELEIVPATHGDQAGVVGGAALALEHVLSPRAVDRLLAR